MNQADHTQLLHYLSAWQLSAPRLLAQTDTGRVYTVSNSEGQQVVLKLIAPNAHEERLGAQALMHFGGRGAVYLLRSDAGAQLLEYAEGDDLTGLVHRGEDDHATGIIAGVIGQLHSIPPDNAPAELVTLDRWFQALFQQARRDPASIYGRGAVITRYLLNNPQDVRVLHGDIHHANIRHSRRGWLAFDPKGLIGERTYDCANTLCNPMHHYPPVYHEARLLRQAWILADVLDMDYLRLLQFTFAYACLSASWFLQSDDTQHAQQTLRIAQLLVHHL
ncbi:MAG: aminoglycoside phosphotransferase family protein [Anaerolineae bacterium]